MFSKLNYWKQKVRKLLTINNLRTFLILGVISHKNRSC